MCNRLTPTCQLIATFITLTIIIYIIIFHYFSTTKPHSVYRLSQMRVENCPKNIVTVISGGRLGNAIWEYLSIVAVGKLFKLQAYTPKDIERELLNVFDWTTPYRFSEIHPYCLKDLDLMQYVNLGDPIIVFPGKENPPVILAKYSARHREIIRYGLDKIRKELIFRNDLVKDANAFMTKLKEAKGYHDPVFVGVHYRGGDYVDALKQSYPKHQKILPDHHYYTMAMDYFRSHYKHVIFIFITIDMQWLHANLQHILQPDVYLRSEIFSDNQQYEDMVLLSRCNHSIINYGTFGATTAIFAGGETFAYDLGLPQDFRGYTLVNGLARKLSNWHLCNNTVCNLPKS